MTTKTIIITMGVAIALLFFMNIYTNLQLVEAQKPTEIEKKYEELKQLEQDWRTAQEYCENKPKIEKEIQEKRAEIIGKK